VENVTEEGLVGPLLLARSAIDRAAALRGDAERLKRLWAEESTRVMVVENGRTLLRRDGEEARIVFLAPHRAPAGERYLLGVDAEGRRVTAWATLNDDEADSAPSLRPLAGGPAVDPSARR